MAVMKVYLNGQWVMVGGGGTPGISSPYAIQNTPPAAALLWMDTTDNNILKYCTNTSNPTSASSWSPVTVGWG